MGFFYWRLIDRSFMKIALLSIHVSETKLIYNDGNNYGITLAEESFGKRATPLLWRLNGCDGPASLDTASGTFLRFIISITSSLVAAQLLVPCFNIKTVFSYMPMVISMMKLRAYTGKTAPPVGSGTPAFRLGSRIDPHRHRGVVKVHWRVPWVGGLFSWVVATFTL